MDLIRNWDNVPILILALSNEAADLAVVMNRTLDAGQAVRTYNPQRDSAFISALDAHLQKAQSHLTDMDALVDSLNSGKSFARRNR